ncbi:MAG: lysostaphin resistance A-like protein [Planctomycetota bacterium]|jgi:membrane protease YdiL (CAAX protease family)
MSDAKAEDAGRPPPPWGPEAAFLFIAVDFGLIILLPFAWRLPARFAAVLLFSAFLLFRLRASPGQLGFRLGSIREGARASAVAAGITGLLLVLGAGVYLLLRSFEAAPALPPPSDAKGDALFKNGLLTLVAYPIVEEWIYRGVLYPPLEHRIGRVGAILLSGLVFQALHLSYGVPWPHYFVGGMILAWAFARSGSLLYPILLHAMWNLFVLGVDLLRGASVIPV